MRAGALVQSRCASAPAWKLWRREMNTLALWRNALVFQRRLSRDTVTVAAVCLSICFGEGSHIASRAPCSHGTSGDHRLTHILPSLWASVRDSQA